MSGTDAGTPDGFYAFVAGCYAASAVAPPVAALVSRATAGDLGVVYVTLLTAFTAVTAVVGILVSRTPGLAVRVGEHSGLWFGAVPVGHAVAVAAGHAAGWWSRPSMAVVLSMVGFAAGVVFGIGLAAMSENRRVRAETADAAEHATFDARLPPRVRDLFRFGGGVAAVLGAAAFALGAYLGVGAVRLAGQMLVPLGVVPVANANAERTFEVTDAGLVLRRPVNARLFAWREFEGYRVTDEALVLRRATWLGLDLRCDRGDLDDPEAVVDALGRFVPESPDSMERGGGRGSRN